MDKVPTNTFPPLPNAKPARPTARTIAAYRFEDESVLEISVIGAIETGRVLDMADQLLALKRRELEARRDPPTLKTVGA